MGNILMGQYDPKKTLDEANQLHVVCPIFHAETPIAACFKLRELVWCGNAPPQRQGCQACMQANKCPINNIIWGMIRHPDSDPYWSSTKKVVNFRDRDLEQIARVIVPERTMTLYNLSDKERAKINEANLAARSGAVGKIRRDFSTDDGVGFEAPAAAAVEDATLAAAKAGDMSAAINAALKE